MLQSALDNPLNLVIIGIVSMLVLAIGIVFFVVLHQRRMLHHQAELKYLNEQKQKELLLASVQSEEEERMRIASELHDDVGATLSSIRLFLLSAIKNKDEALLQQSKELLDESIERVRSISHKLQPAMLQRLGLKVTLETLAQTITKSGALKITCMLKTVPMLEENVAMALYRIIQELINNIIKHSHATSVQIEGHIQENDFCLILLHNGQGLTDEAFHKLIYKKGAIGLKNIVNRVEVINGMIRFCQRKDELFETSICVPLAAK